MTQFQSKEGYTLRDYQREFISDVVSKYPHVATFDDMGLGKGHPAGTKVLTPTKWVEVQELTPGMYVVGSDGNATMLTAVYDRGVLPVYKVTMSDGSSVEVDGEHLWQVTTPIRKKRGNPPLVKSTMDLMAGGLRSSTNRKWFIPLVQPVNFEFAAEELLLDPWLLGVLIGDGSYSQQTVAITKRNANLFELVQQALPQNHTLNPVDDLTQRIVTSNPRNFVVAALKSMGMMGHRSSEKTIPHAYLRAAPSDRLALLQGLLDTDSEIIGSTVQHTTSSKQLALQVQFLVQSLGGTAKINPRSTFYNYKGERKDGRTNYRTTINLGDMQLFRTTEKQSLYTAKTKYMPTRAIDSIEYAGEKHVYCLSVAADDKLYVTEQFIVTHNTVQCIAADKYRRQKAGPGPHKTLVVAPLTGVIDQWVEAFNSWQPDLVVRRVNPKKRYLFLKEEADVYIIHPEGLRLEADALSQVNWLHMIFDEVHRIKNRKTKTAKAAVAVGKSAQYRTGATGTPIENRADEMWHILKWLYPDAASRKSAGFNHWTQKLLASYWRFYERFTKYDVDPWTGYHTITGTKNEAELRELFGPLYVRRYKQDVAKELPDKQYQKYYVTLPPKQRKAYNAMRDELLAWVGENENQPVIAPVVIAQLIRLQQFALGYGEIKTVTKVNVDGGVRKEREESSFTLSEPSVKLDALMDILDDLGDKQAVVFTTSKQAVGLANARFEKAGISAVTITGDISDAQRTLNIRKHQAGEAQVLIATIRAGGVGINLQHCDIMVFLDRDWSPAKNKQAEDRLHRIGQKNTVHIIDIVARDTIDQRKDDVLQKKWSWVRATVGARD